MFHSRTPAIHALKSGGLALGVLLGSTLPAGAVEADALKVNTWHSHKPAFKFLPGLKGHYQDRGWCTLRYQSRNKSMIFYEGYTRDQDCIYANSLYEYHPDQDTVHMRTISNWNCREHTVGPAMPDNAAAPTPMDRHTYAQFAYAPTTNKVYMAHGAMGNNNHQHDLWAYNFDTRRWENLGAAPGGTQAWECTCALNLIYTSATDELYFFASQRAVYVYKLSSGTWRSLTPRNATGKDIGGHGLYDPKRNLFAFYGNNWTSDDSGSNTFLLYNPVANAWTEMAPTGSWPPAKSYASMEYNSKQDLYLLHGGWRQNDTWIWYPSAQVWREVQTTNRPAAITNRGTYTAYNPDMDALVVYSANTMWFLRVVADGNLAPVHKRDGDRREGSITRPRGWLGGNLDGLRRQGQESAIRIRDVQNRMVPPELILDWGRETHGKYILERGPGVGNPAGE